MNRYKKQSGFSLIELLVAISFIAVIIVLILTINYSNKKLYNLNEETTQAMFYASEAMEAMQMFDWDELATGTYSVDLSSNSWVLSAGSQTVGGIFNREITISDVYRQSSSNTNVYGNIVSSGGYLDPDTKQITVTVSWDSKAGVSKQEQLSTYLYRWGADRWTQNDWIGGAGQSIWSDDTKFFYKDTGIDISIPGVVTLKAGFIDWNYANTTSTLDTPGNFDDNDVYEVNEIAYLVTENNPSGSEFYVIDVSDVSNPWQMASLDVNASITSVVVQGDYAYISTDDNSGELKVVDISNSYFPSIVFSHDLPSNDNAYDVAVNENELYIIQGATLYSFSLADPEAPAYLDSLYVDNEASEIFLSENYVYVATLDADKELQIIDVTNPANLSPAGIADLPGALKGTDVFVRGTRAYISTQNNGGGAEFFVFNISDPTSPVYMGSYEVNETIHSFTIIGPYALVGTNFLEEELIVIDVSYPETINKVSGFNLDGYVLGMSANCSIIYAATSGNQGEFFIITTDVFDCEYADSGNLESSTFDTGSDQVAYNWIAWTGAEPLNTDIKVQIATSANQSGPWNFVGPDGTSSTYYSVAASELINYNHHLNQRYLRYKLFLTSQADLQVPSMEDITISYSIN